MTRNSNSIDTKAVNFKAVKSVDDRKVFLFVTALEAVFIASFFLLYNC